MAAKGKKKPASSTIGEYLTAYAITIELGVNAQTLRKVLHGETPDKMEGNRKLWSLARVREILKKRTKALDDASNTKTPSARKYDLECRKLLQQIDDMEFTAGVKRGNYTKTDDVVEFLQTLIGQFDSILDRKLVLEYPKLVSGLDTRGARVKGRQLQDDIREMMRNELAKWI